MPENPHNDILKLTDEQKRAVFDDYGDVRELVIYAWKPRNGVYKHLATITRPVDGASTMPADRDNYRLCYVDAGKAWFTSDFENQWGDDWNDAPYEYNAGDPYSPRKDGDPRVFSVKLTGSYKSPCTDSANNPFSVEDINRGNAPWISFGKTEVYGGTTFSEFRRVAGVLLTEDTRDTGRLVDEIDTAVYQLQIQLNDHIAEYRKHKHRLSNFVETGPPVGDA